MPFSYSNGINQLLILINEGQQPNTVRNVYSLPENNNLAVHLMTVTLTKFPNWQFLHLNEVAKMQQFMSFINEHRCKKMNVYSQNSLPD